MENGKPHEEEKRSAEKTELDWLLRMLNEQQAPTEELEKEPLPTVKETDSPVPLLIVEDVDDEEKSAESFTPLPAGDVPLIFDSTEYVAEDDDRGSTYDANEAPTWYVSEDAMQLSQYDSPLSPHVVLLSRNDRPAECVRKMAFWLFSVILVVFCGYMLWTEWLQPTMLEKQSERLAEAFHAGEGTSVTAQGAPEGMLPVFGELYSQNREVAGWLEFRDDAEASFLAVDAPVMYSDSNQKYTALGVTGHTTPGGSLFFDSRCHVSDAWADDRLRIIYGYNTAAGGKMADLSQLVGSVHYARTATRLTLTTLFEEQQYQVFAIVLTDENADEAYYFNPRRMHFTDDADFAAYLADIQARSLFNYPVEVTAADHVLAISTNVSASVSKLDNARLTVFARRVTDGREAVTDKDAISQNSTVIMPYAWYTAQSEKPHSYYDKPETLSKTTTTATTTVTTTGTTATENSTAANATTGTTAKTRTTAASRTVTAAEQTGTTAAKEITMTQEAATTAEATTAAPVETTAESTEPTFAEATTTVPLRPTETSPGSSGGGMTVPDRPF